MTNRRPKGPAALIILDGYGDAPAGPFNAISVANPKFIHEMESRYPRGQLHTSGECVGLPDGLMGNSEVGHMNLGAGRVIWQDITRIDRTIRDGSFFRNPVFLDLARHAISNGKSVHLVGLVSDGGVHSSDRHVIALLKLFQEEGVPGDRVFIHALTDGRDTPPKSAIGFVGDLERHLCANRQGRIASVVGRYFAMDRDHRWDRVERGYRCLVEGRGEAADSGVAAVLAAYERGETDEFLQPTVVGGAGSGRIADGDAVLVFNFRADRVREITLALMDPAFADFPLASPRPALRYATMTRYRKDFRSLGVKEAFQPQSFHHLLADVVADAGLAQLRIAETEKYAHVTYFFNGGVEEPKAREDRILVPSPKVATYDLQPEMSAPEVTDRLVAEIGKGMHDLIVLNLANPDMVGHTGILEAAVAAVKTVDASLARIIPAILARSGTVLLTADHGNCEQMQDPITGEPHTAHTTNPVPLHLIGDRFRGAKLREGGALSDVSPTILQILGIDVPDDMTARSLLEP